MAFLCLVGAWFGASRMAEAQLTSQQKQEVRLHYEKATRAYDVGKYEEAIAEYQNVYEISGDSKMLYNIGQAYRLNGQPEQASRFYRRYLQRLPSAANREDVEKKIADQEKLAEEQKAAAAAAAVAAAAANQPPPPAPVTTPLPVTPSPSPAAPAPRVEVGTSGARIASYVCLAVGGAGLATAAVAGFIAKNKSDELTRDSQQPGTPFRPSLESQGKTWNKVAIGAAIGGGVVVLAGGILFLASGDGTTQETSAKRQRFLALPTFGPEGPGFAASLTF